MSVDFFAPLPSEWVQSQVLAFFGDHFRPWPKLRPGPDPHFPNEPEGFTAASNPTADFNSEAYPFKVGIRYGAIHGGERYYVQSIVRFAALRWGLRQVVRDDEIEKLILQPTLHGVQEDAWWDVVDHLGIQVMFRLHHTELAMVQPGDLELIENELLRLQRLW